MKKMFSFIKKHINIVYFIIAVIILISANIGYTMEGNILKFNYNSYSVFTLILLYGIYALIKSGAKNSDKRLKICVTVLAIFLAIFNVIGEFANEYVNFNIIISKKMILYIVLRFIVYFGIFAPILINLVKFLEKVFNKENVKEKQKTLFTNNKKSFILLAVIFFICTIPYFLYYIPGSLEWDIVYVIKQIFGIVPFTNHQPWLYTLIIKFFLNIGNSIFGNYTIGMIIYTIIQMILTACTFSGIIYFLAKYNVNVKIRILVTLFFILNPIIGMYTVRIEKDIPFALAFIWMSLGIIDMIHQPKDFFRNKVKIIFWVINTILLFLLRNNAIYAFILTFLIMILFSKHKKYIALVFIIPIIGYYIIQGSVLKSMNIENGNIGEALSIPLQQFARVMKYNELTDQEEKEIMNYTNLSKEQIINGYTPTLSDPIKGYFNEEYFSNNKLEFIKLYLKLAIKYPKDTLLAFIFNNYGYYAPNSNNIVGIQSFQEESVRSSEAIKSEIGIDVDTGEVKNNNIIQIWNNYISDKNFPILSLFATSIGLYFNIVLLCITYCIYRKEYKKILYIMPIIFLWLTLLAGPVVELRYIYPIILLVPVYIIFAFSNINKENKEEV